jgi:hypothetical protein
VNSARNLYYAKNADAIASGNTDQLQPVTGYDVSFGVKGFLQSGDPFADTFSPARFFVGTYSINIYPYNDGNSLLFVLRNDTNTTSLGHQFGFNGSLELPSYSRPTPGGNFSQIYWWTEPRR